jgi:hypothetical protein
MCRFVKTPRTSLAQIEPSNACTSRSLSYKHMALTNLSSNIGDGGDGDTAHAMETSISGSRGFWVLVDRAWGCEDMLISLTIV